MLHYLGLLTCLSFALLFLRTIKRSMVRQMKIILALFVIGSAAHVLQEYLVPRARASEHFDLATFATIVICTLATCSNIGHWVFATTYFHVGNKFEKLVYEYTSASGFDAENRQR